MQKIFDPDETVVKLCGTQKEKPGTKYRLNTHCIWALCDEGTLLFHTMTGAMYLTTSDESIPDDIGCSNEIPVELLDDNLRELLSQWFLVPEDYDEKKQVDDLRHVSSFMRLERKTIDHFTIVTTTDCNARCFYCYEAGTRKLVMTESTAEDVAEYIIRKSDGEEIKIKWFGGEPFMNQEAIDIICQQLHSAGMRYQSSSTSNGYYLDAKTVKKAKELWHLRGVQITIDGTEEIYNRTKDYVDCAGSAYKRVLDNIEALLDNGIHVMIRMNMHNGNYDDLLHLCDEMQDRFGDRSGWHMRVINLKNTDGHGYMCDDELITETMTELLNDRIQKMGVYSTGGLVQGIVNNQCMADNDSCEVIFPDGTTGRCENYNEREITGSIYQKERDADVTRSWMERYDHEECSDCAVYPQCIRLKKCFWTEKHCSEMYRRNRVTKIKEAMIEEYIRSKNSI